MGTRGDSFVSRDEFQNQPSRKPTLFERFKLWRNSGSAEQSPPVYSADLKTSREILETDFRDKFSARLDELVNRGTAQRSDSSGGPMQPARPASDSLYMQKVTTAEKALLERSFEQMTGNLDELAKILTGIGASVGETNTRGSEMRTLVENLPEVIQALPAIGRGQLSILSGIASEQRSIGATLADRIEKLTDLDGERTLDVVRSVERLGEHTGEIVRSVDELSGVMRDLPGSVQAQTEVLEEARRRLAALDETRAQMETMLMTSFTRQEDILLEGFVNQTAAFESLRETMEDVAARLDDPRPQAEIIPIEQLRKFKGYALASAAAMFLLLFGFGAAIWKGFDSPNVSADTADLIREMQEGRRTSDEQFASYRLSTTEALDRSEKRIAEQMAEYANLMQANEKLLGLVRTLGNDKEVMGTRLRTLANENDGLRNMLGESATALAAKAEPKQD